MGCFPCFSAKKQDSNDEEAPISQPKVCNNKSVPVAESNHNEEAHPVEATAKTFNFRELATATKNFRHECLMGEGGFGRIYIGKLNSSGETVAVRQLDRNVTLGSKEFQGEVVILSLLQHPNLVKMIGYFADGDQRLLVYEHLPLGSLKNHLFGVSGEKRPLDWSTRMKIAAGIAQGLGYLHEKANPPIIYRYLKSSSILLDETNTPKLSEYGLAKLLQSSSRANASPRITTAYGFCAPEYDRYGEVTLKSDVYSFGVVLLELITGRRAFESDRPTEDQNLVSWAQSFFGNPKRYPDMADPLMRNEFPSSSLHQAVGVASMCLQEEPSVRPLITDVATALNFLALPPAQARTETCIVPVTDSATQLVN